MIFQCYSTYHTIIVYAEVLKEVDVREYAMQIVRCRIEHLE